MIRKAVFYSILCLMVLAPVAGAELALRWIGLGDPVLYAANSAYRYAPAPNQRKKRRRGAIVTIDSHGLRGVEDWNAPADRRILFIGDSVTWGGTSIDDREIFSHLTCVELERRGGAHTCGNAGVNAYGVDNMAARLRYGDFARADAIVVTLISGDATRGLNDPGRSYVYTVAPHGPLKALWEAVGYAIYHASRMLTQAPANRSDAYDLPVAQRSLDALFAILWQKQSEGKEVLVVFSPYERELKGEESEMTRLVRRRIRESTLPYLDLTDPMRAEQAAGGAPLYIDGIHLERRGHRLYGKWIAAAFLRKRNRSL